MKKQLTVALGLAVLATPAFATKARLQALGEDNYGSAYINDNRNIWLNAAQINNHKDLVTYEFGSNNVTSDNANTSRGEGGVYRAFGNMVYGLHFGGASTTANGLRAGAGMISAAGVATNNEENNIDAFVGGDAGVKWGVNVGYAQTKNDNTTAVDTRGEALRSRLGIIAGDTQAYANINLMNRATGLNTTGAGKAEFDGKLGYQLGVIQAWNGNTLFADWRQFNAKGTFDPALSKEDQKTQQGYVGIGRVERLNDKTNLFMKAQYLWGKATNDVLATNATFAAVGAAACSSDNATLCAKYRTSRVPVTIGLENEATSWLTLRASVSQVVWGTEKVASNERGVRNSTAINAGATLKFGELSVDGVIGNAADASTTAGTTGIRNSNSGTNGTLRLDQLMSRVAMTYRF